MKIHRFFALPAAAKAIVVRSLLLLPVVAALLRTRGLARTRSWLGGRAAPALAPRETARLVHGAAAVLRIGCLPRSLTLLHLLGACGTRAVIRFGVQKPAAGGLAAHSWIEFDGQPLGENRDLLDAYAGLTTASR